MDFSMNGLSIEEAKRINMVSYLSSLGHQPARIRGVDFWYLSPLRDEKTPSFKINSSINRWYDFGLGKGGSIFDFCLLYFDSTIPKIIQNLSGSLVLSRSANYSVKDAITDIQSKIKILDEFELTSGALIRYLKQPCIQSNIACYYCKEIRYQLYDKAWYGIGFKNDLGDYEIRKKYLKGSSAPKDITTICNYSSKVSVFEGFFDLLFYLSITTKFELPETNYIILNSLSFFEKAKAVMETYESIHLYLDNNNAGQNCSSYALSLSAKYADESRLYKGHDDLNDFLIYGIDENATGNLQMPRPP